MSYTIKSSMAFSLTSNVNLNFLWYYKPDFIKNLFDDNKD